MRFRSILIIIILCRPVLRSRPLLQRIWFVYKSCHFQKCDYVIWLTTLWPLLLIVSTETRKNVYQSHRDWNCWTFYHNRLQRRVLWLKGGEVTTGWTEFHNEKFYNFCSSQNIIINQLTPWSKVLAEKLTGLQLTKKFPAINGNWIFATAFTSAGHQSLSRVRRIQFIPPYPTAWSSISVLTSHQHLLPNIIMVIEIRWLKWTWHVPWWGGGEVALQVLIGKPEEKRSHEIRGCICKDNTVKPA